MWIHCLIQHLELEFFLLDDTYNPLGHIYVWLSSMGSSSSKEPEKSTEVGPPTKQMKDSPTINTQAPEQPNPQGAAHISPAQEQKLHLPKLQVPDKDF